MTEIVRLSTLRMYEAMERIAKRQVEEYRQICRTEATNRALRQQREEEMDAVARALDLLRSEP